MNIRQIQEARESFGIDDWGAGYFGINDVGAVVAHPTGDEQLSVPLPDIMAELHRRGLDPPVILRFPQIIEGQLERMHTAFRDAIWEFNFRGRHIGVFPFKVNQRREFIDAVVDCGQKYGYGLEVGSKTELVAALSYGLAGDSLLIANGFKDREFIDLTFAAAAMNKNVVVVVEGPDELEMVIERAREQPVCPAVGFRVRLYSKGSGKWEKSSGDTSKFGLTTTELLRSLRLLENAGMRDALQMLHFHIGSQITEIKRFKNAIKEASRVYAKVVKMGYRPSYLNIGGGVGVDYDGSKTSFLSSANYSVQEFANDAVYVLGEVCDNEDIPHPTIVTESGRIIAAYHAVVVTDVREVQGEEITPAGGPAELGDSEPHKSIKELQYILDNINRKNFIEFYHDAIEYHEELFTLFNLGYLNLRERAMAEELYQRICRRALYYSSFQRHAPEEFEELQKHMVSKYLANFSIFQSIPDAWSIDHLFPVMPLSRHDEKPSQKSTIVDITCDSDGCLDRFIDRIDVKRSIDLHTPNDQPYYIGFFLTGAYQESLANEHNLFGAIHEAEIHARPGGDWEILKTTSGDTIDELLEARHYRVEELLESYRRQLDEAGLGETERRHHWERLSQALKSYPYLRKE